MHTTEGYKEMFQDATAKPNFDTILGYMANKLTQEEKYELEKQMMADPFYNDAVEGLQIVSSKYEIYDEVIKLDKKLRKHVIAQNKKNKIKPTGPQIWQLTALAIVLILIIVSYIVIAKLLNTS